MNKVFNTKKLEKLNNPSRIKSINPNYIWDLLKLKNPEVLVDIGAGTGIFSIEFSKKMNNSTIYACDISSVMIDWMRENIVISNPSIKPTLLNNSSLPLDNNKADLVFMITLHHELDETKYILDESFRILKDSGKILIVDWKVNGQVQGPSQDIRVNPLDVKLQLEASGFKNCIIDSYLENFFIVIAEK